MTRTIKVCLSAAAIALGTGQLLGPPADPATATGSPSPPAKVTISQVQGPLGTPTVSVSVAPPATDGGQPVSYYALVSYNYPGGVESEPKLVAAASLPAIEQLPVDKSFYTFTAAAFNGSFWGVWAAWSNWLYVDAAHVPPPTPVPSPTATPNPTPTPVPTPTPTPLPTVFTCQPHPCTVTVTSGEVSGRSVAMTTGDTLVFNLRGQFTPAAGDFVADWPVLDLQSVSEQSSSSGPDDFQAVFKAVGPGGTRVQTTLILLPSCCMQPPVPFTFPVQVSGPRIGPPNQEPDFYVYARQADSGKHLTVDPGGRFEVDLPQGQGWSAQSSAPDTLLLVVEQDCCGGYHSDFVAQHPGTSTVTETSPGRQTLTYYVTVAP